MKNLLICRVCLIEDNRSKSIVGTHLQEIYESLVLMPFETADDRPLLVCYICRARLQNCYDFRKSCLESEELFTQMLSCNEYEQVKVQAINNKKRLTIHNTVEWILGMDEDNVGVEALNCEVKDEPNDDVDRDDFGASSVSDYVLDGDSDSKNKESMGHELEMDADSDDGETLVLLCDVKDEQSDVEGASTSKEPSKSVQRSSEDSTSSNLNEHDIVQDKFKNLYDITVADITDDNKEKTHMRTHTSEKPYHCDICKKQLSHKGHFIRHMRTHTNKKLYYCVICKKQFSKKDNLTKHMRTHTSNKPHHCIICDKQFLIKSNLITHMRTHTGEKPYHCDICEKQFSQKVHLTTHRRTHTGEKPYHCDICKKLFSEKSCLNTHIRQHTGEKPYHCDICKKQFSLKSSLNRHMRTHTSEYIYDCDICKKNFSHKGNFRTHMRLQTGDKPYH